MVALLEMLEREKENTREKSERRTQRHGSEKELLSRSQTVSGRQIRVRLRLQSSGGGGQPTKQENIVPDTPDRRPRAVQRQDAVPVDPTVRGAAPAELIAQGEDESMGFQWVESNATVPTALTRITEMPSAACVEDGQCSCPARLAECHHQEVPKWNRKLDRGTNGRD